jgi:hypothetical protein
MTPTSPQTAPSQDRARESAFLAMLQPFTPAAAALICQMCTPMVKWTGSTKRTMAQALASKRYGQDVSVDDLRRQILTFIAERFGTV